MSVVVVVIDSGITFDQAEPAALLPGVNFSREGAPDDTGDRANHGTAVARTVLRLAPQARLLPLKLMDRRGMLRDRGALEDAFGWVLEQREARDIGLVCAAFADTSHAISDAEHSGSRLRRQIAALRERGVATVAAAGNWYPEHRRYAPQGMAWPAILRETISVGALEPGGARLARTTQRLHATLATGCATTVFVEPEPPGETSGAAAALAGYLAALLDARPGATVDALLDRLRAAQRSVQDESGLAWPALDPRAVLKREA